MRKLNLGYIHGYHVDLCSVHWDVNDVNAFAFEFVFSFLLESLTRARSGLS